jgi:hypothetical protein
MTKEKTLFPKIDSFEKVIKNLQLALRQAAEEFYQNEMVDTNMHIFEIREEAEKYEYYADENSRQEAIENCQWATKEEWIQDKIKEWMKNR